MVPHFMYIYFHINFFATDLHFISKNIFVALVSTKKLLYTWRRKASTISKNMTSCRKYRKIHNKKKYHHCWILFHFIIIIAVIIFRALTLLPKYNTWTYFSCHFMWLMVLWLSLLPFFPSVHSHFIHDHSMHLQLTWLNVIGFYSTESKMIVNIHILAL